MSAHLNVTMACNFRCQYCFVSHNSSAMAPETASKALDWLAVRKAPGQRQLNIDFFGGEPTLNWPAIVAAVEHGEREHPDRFKWGLVTNCSLLDAERISFLAKHRFGVLASYDGRHTQDIRAQGSGPLVEETVRKLLAAGVRVSVAMTLAPGQTQHMCENWVSGLALGVRSVSINYYVAGGMRRYDEADWRNIDEQYDQVVDHLVRDWLAHEPGQRVHCNLLERHLPGIRDKALRRYKGRSDWACGACKGSLGIWPDGTVMPCHEHSPMMYPHWILGNVITGEFDDARRCLYTEVKYRECDACEVTSCGHCRVRAFEATGCETEHIEDTCRYLRLLYGKAIQLWNRLIEVGADWRTVC